MKEKTLLAVDDVTMFLELQADYLRYSKVNVITAKNGNQALEIVKRNHPNLIVMDLHMPGMDGDECCHKLKTSPEFMHIPVIMTTTGGKTEDIDRCYLAHCDDFIRKPYDRDTYLAVIKNHIKDLEMRKKRIAFNTKVVFNKNGVDLIGTIININVTGAYIVSDCHLVPGDVIQLMFTLPDRTRVSCHGRIIWVNRDYIKLPRGFGVQFALVPKEANSALAGLIEAS